MQRQDYAYLIIVASLLVGHTALAADWPQFRGLQRDGQSEETGLLKCWPEGGPKQLWVADGLGEGWSSASISDGSIYITGMEKKKEYLVALDLAGQRRWQKEYGTATKRSFPGARTTPTVEGDRVYVISGSGEIVCLKTQNGDVVWQVDARAKFAGVPGAWDTAESVVISGNKLFYTPCGEDTTVVALDKMTGETIWKTESLNDQSGYVTAILIERGGREILVNVTGSYVIGVDTAKGQILWTYAYVKNHPTNVERRLKINAVSPLYHDGGLFVTSGYDHVGVMLSLSADGTQVSREWVNEAFDCHHGGVVRVGDYIYGSNWEGNSGGKWLCVDWKTGETVYETGWNDNKGPVVVADGMLYCCDEDLYNVGLAEPSPDGFKVVSSFKITLGEDKLWAHPSISDGRLYIRHGAFLMAYDISDSKSEPSGYGACLFDGATFTGWEGNLDWFRIEDNAIVAGTLDRPIPRNEFLCTKEAYGDFELRLKVKLLGPADKANAGIQIRSRRIRNHHEMIGYQADMGQHYWGALYDESRRRKVLAGPNKTALMKVLKQGDWNDYRIRCQGRRIQLWINGLKTVDYVEPDDDIERTGVIGLQIHSGVPSEAWYKDIQIEPLDPVTFRIHTINHQSKFEAAGILDVNRDGKLDILSGGFWYEAPKWNKHRVREVKEQGEYYYDFANLPFDVDGDGWTDIINAAWHNKMLFWVENPGPEKKDWPVHEIDTPGNMETATLHDISGDGTLDILPAAIHAHAWYETRIVNGKAQWTKHALPAVTKGHGIGAGDVDGDGRCDIVACNGWLQQPAAGDWVWHADFKLGSTSCPILVFDVDSDGDSDIIWGMGHDYGLYWLEQGKTGDGTRTWTKHTIDDTWSQPHFPLLTDLDNDGKEELVVGKRYRAHNGKDPGGKDDPCVYWYDYDVTQGQWNRYVIHEGGTIGFGINTEAKDLDQDGDLDIVAPGKSGLYLFENLLK